MTGDQIRLWWTGTADYHPEVARWALGKADTFRRECPDGQHGWQHGSIIEAVADGVDVHVFIYWTKARAVVVRIHGLGDDNTDALLAGAKEVSDG